MRSLEQALDSLLHRASERAAFLRGGGLDVSQDDLAALRCIDPGELERAAAAVRDDLLARTHRGSGGLLAQFPLTIGAADPRALVDRFLESAAFETYREVPFAGRGTCLEDAFFRFCEASDLGDPVIREREVLAAVVRTLVVSPHPAFTLPDAVRRCPGGFFAIASRGAPMLYAASRGRFITGALTPVLAAVLLTPERDAARHDVPPSILQAALAQFAAMGLIADSERAPSARSRPRGR